MRADITWRPSEQLFTKHLTTQVGKGLRNDRITRSTVDGKGEKPRDSPLIYFLKKSLEFS